MRPSNFIGVLVCAFSLVFAYYFLQLYMGLMPCPLCILDRFVVAGMGIVFAAGLFVSRAKPRLILLGANAALLCLGLFFAGRHVWLQNRPYDPETECLADTPVAESMIELVRQAFDTQIDCTLILWELFGLTIPDLTLLLFVGIGILLGSQLWGIREDRRARSGD